MLAPAEHAGPLLRPAIAARTVWHGRQPALKGGIGGCLDADFAQHPSRVDLAGGFDDAGEDEIAKHTVTLGGRLEPQHSVGPAQCFPQVGHSRGGDRQRAGPNLGTARGPIPFARRASAQQPRCSARPIRSRRAPSRCVRSNVSPAATTTRSAPPSPQRRSSRYARRPSARWL